MNILHLAHRIPYPPDKGDKLRAFRQIEHLSRRHCVTAAFFVDDPDDARHVDGLRAHCAEVIPIRINRAWRTTCGAMRWLCGGTITEGFYDVPELYDAVAQLCRTTEFDAVLAFSSGVAPIALAIPARRRVLDLCDLDSGKWTEYARRTRQPLRWIYRAEGDRLARRERQWAAAFDATILITRAEADALDRADLADRIHVISNGVTLPILERFPEPQASACAMSPSHAEPETSTRAASRTPTACPPTVAFVGQMDYLPNIDAVRWFAHTCWPIIRRRIPDARFRIIGRRPTRAVRRLARIAGIEVTGAVADIHAELRRIDVSVAPLHIARGLQNKVLEAMAAAKPVVLTAAAATGIDARNGEALIIADAPEDLPEQTLRLLSDPDARARIGLAARRFVETRHNWDREMIQLETVLTGGVESANAPRPWVDAARSAHESHPCADGTARPQPAAPDSSSRWPANSRSSTVSPHVGTHTVPPPPGRGSGGGPVTRPG